MPGQSSSPSQAVLELPSYIASIRFVLATAVTSASQFLLEAVPKAMKIDATTSPHDVAKAIYCIGWHPRDCTDWCKATGSR